MNFPSTLLPQTNDPQEIQKAVLDLLAKINTIGGTPGAVSVNPVADTAANFTSKNPTLLAGQLGYETDTKFFKIGDGSTAWTSLVYQSVKNAPLPQTAAGVGQWLLVNPGVGGAFVLPAGGTWSYFATLYTGAGLQFNSVAGLGAGGATMGAGVIGYYWWGFNWRIA